MGGETPAERARLFLKASKIVRRRRSEIAEVLARETGSTISFATFQQDLVAATLQQVAGWVYLPKGEVLEGNLSGTHSVGVRCAFGVVASFTPWNGANVLSWRAVISPVAAGNAVVVKPSEFAPVSAGIMIAEAAEEAGFPARVINVVTHAPGGAGAIAGEAHSARIVRLGDNGDYCLGGNRAMVWFTNFEHLTEHLSAFKTKEIGVHETRESR
jgi:acyl-CoA reductase-like NAD-dependent aldehyde dehydrogenase